MMQQHLAAIALLQVLLSACSSVPNAADTIAPNANLHVQGIPPIPLSVADDVAKYSDFRGHGFVAWHPTRREMLVAHRGPGANTVQLYRVAAPMAAPEPLTDSAELVYRAECEPVDGRYIVLARSMGGDEADQLYRLDLPAKQTTLLTDPHERHALQGWLKRSGQMLVISTPLDRTAQGGSRDAISQTLQLIDPLQQSAPRLLKVLPGGGWHNVRISTDEQRVALTRRLSANESQVWMLELANGRFTQLLPAEGRSDTAAWTAGEFTRDGAGLFMISDQGREF